LPQLWRRGDWSGLALALGFTLLLNLVLLTTLVWTELVSPLVEKTAWMALGGVWLASAVWSWRSLRRSPQLKRGTNQDLFPQAIREYLKGNWFEVEAMCRQLLVRDDRDVDTHLLLATMYRRTARWDEAHERLEQLSKLTYAAKWHWEVQAERQRLSEAQQAAKEVPAESPGVEIRGAA
jgi:hypothetical protein